MILREYIKGYENHRLQQLAAGQSRSKQQKKSRNLLVKSDKLVETEPVGTRRNQLGRDGAKAVESRDMDQKDPPRVCMQTV